MLHGYALQRAESYREAKEVFARACTLGSAIGCTNVGAELWLGNQSAPAHDEACARRLFERACEVREPFGCGMVGRMMSAAAKTSAEREAARKHFERACNELGGVTCTMYGLHLELGELGPHEPRLVRALLLRACDTGTQEACDATTAGELFR